MRDSWKNLNFTISKFWAQWYADNMTNKRWKAFKQKKWRTLQKRLRDGVRRICQTLYQKNHCNSKLTWSEHLECHWWDSVQRSSLQNTGWAQKATQLCLEKCDLRLYMLTKLVHSIPHRLENVKNNKGPSWLLIFLLFNIKWKRNDIPNCKKK